VNLTPGTRLGRYEILSLSGAGGMGAVYRARDPRLGRVVAIKVIGPAFETDSNMRQRFEDEARLAAQLDHPRICTVHDFGTDAGVDYLVMEFLEGRSLASRLKSGTVDVSNVIGCAIEMADALAYAHRRGVVHRDIKPGNVLLTANGLKIIDFGLGRLRHVGHTPSPQVASLDTAPLRPGDSASLTGTAQYVAPERLQGFESDHRGDIFAFGAVLYEMLVGRRAFEGATPADVIAAILTSEPPPIGKLEPPYGELEWLIRRCLRKRPEERWDSMADVHAILKRIAAPPADVVGSPRRGRTLRAAGIAAAALLCAALLTELSVVGGRVRPADDALIAVAISPPAGTTFTAEGSRQSPQLAVSPDGRMVAFIASVATGTPELWIRPVDSTVARRLPGTDHATCPFWSPSGRSLGFFADKMLKRVDIDGGPPRALASAPNGRGGTWNGDNVILFAPDAATPIYRVDATSGAVQQTRLLSSRGETSHRWPQFLPDGRRFIYFARSSDERRSGIYVSALDERDETLAIPTNFGAVFAAPDQLLYVAEGALVSSAFDPRTARISGEPRLVVDHIATSGNFYGAFSASTNGVLAYATMNATQELAWVDRAGKRLGLASPRSEYVDFRLSPDGRYVAVAEIDPRTNLADLHVLDTIRGTKTRLTSSPATDASPVWSPDARRIVFRSNRDGIHDLFIGSPSRSDDERSLLKTPSSKYPTSWATGGDFIVFHTNDPRSRFDVWGTSVSHPDQARPLVQTAFDEMQGQISPNERWLAYTSNESGQLQVYVQAMSDGGAKLQVSVSGGFDPRWRADGKELFYIGPDNRLMAVTVTSGETSLDFATPRPLFDMPGVLVLSPFLSSYDVDATGRRFLVRVPLEDPRTSPLTMLVHWMAAAHATQ
jgi:eukaryotic-like serine/threonine-protein kinase